MNQKCEICGTTGTYHGHRSGGRWLHYVCEIKDLQAEVGGLQVSLEAAYLESKQLQAEVAELRKLLHDVVKTDSWQFQLTLEASSGMSDDEQRAKARFDFDETIRAARQALEGE